MAARDALAALGIRRGARVGEQQAGHAAGTRRSTAKAA